MNLEKEKLDILFKYCSKNGFMNVSQGESTMRAMDEYAKYYHEAKLKEQQQAKTEALNIPDVINSGLPEWLDVETRAEAKYYFDSHRIANDGLILKAVRLIQQRAKSAGYDIGLSKAMDILKSHCL